MGIAFHHLRHVNVFSFKIEQFMSFPSRFGETTNDTLEDSTWNLKMVNWKMTFLVQLGDFLGSSRFIFHGCNLSQP